MQPLGTAPPRLKIGILANELFASGVGRMGGFGWAVRSASHALSDDTGPGFDLVLVMGERVRTAAPLPARVHGIPVLWRSRWLWSWLRRVRAERIDLLLTIDYRPNYRLLLALLPRTPVVVWVRDPRTHDDLKIIETVRIPGQEAVLPQGTRTPRTGGLRQMFRLSSWARRPMLFGVTTPYLAQKVAGTYGVRGIDVSVLPNPLEPCAGVVRKAEHPVVAFLGRLDPIKRPWLVWALAERLPDVEFVVMGGSYFDGPGSWQPQASPPNVRLSGHLDDAAKSRVLESSWLLLNTSIHESLAISFLEALACETPLVSSVNPEDLVSRFGIWVGRFPGSGTDGLDAFAAAIRELVEDGPRRHRIGADGRAWVEATHSRAEFLRSFRQLCARATTRTDGSNARVPAAPE